MPCRDYDFGAVQSNNDFEVKQLQSRCDHLTKMLCGLVNAIIKAGMDEVFLDNIEGLKSWWRAHVKQDMEARAKRRNERKVRRHKKKVKRIALSKLSDEEIKELGLI